MFRRTWSSKLARESALSLSTFFISFCPASSSSALNVNLDIRSAGKRYANKFGKKLYARAPAAICASSLPSSPFRRRTNDFSRRPICTTRPPKERSILVHSPGYFNKLFLRRILHDPLYTYVYISVRECGKNALRLFTTSNEAGSVLSRFPTDRKCLNFSAIARIYESISSNICSARILNRVFLTRMLS